MGNSSAYNAEYYLMNKDRINSNRKKHSEKSSAQSASHNWNKKVNGYDMHHWSYLKEHQLDIIYLTLSDHRRLHNNIVYDKELCMYKTLDGRLLDTRESHLEYAETLNIKDKLRGI